MDLAGEVTSVEMYIVPFLELLPWGFTITLKGRSYYCYFTRQENEERKRDVVLKLIS